MSRQKSRSIGRFLKADGYRAFGDIRFPVSCLLVFLCWYVNARRFRTSEDLIGIYVNTWGRSIVTLLDMVIAAFPFATAVCEDRRDRMLRYSVLRGSVPAYTGSKLAICFFSSFAAIFIGINGFVLKEMISYTAVAPNSITAVNFSVVPFGGLLKSHPLLFIELQTALDSLLCAAYSCLALALSIKSRYSYGTYVMPFIFYYILFEEIPGQIPWYLTFRECFELLTFPVEIQVWPGIIVCVAALTTFAILFISYRLMIGWVRKCL